MVREVTRDDAEQLVISDFTNLVGPRGVEYRRDEQTGETSWYVYDGLGSVLSEVDEDGNTC